MSCITTAQINKTSNYEVQKLARILEKNTRQQVQTLSFTNTIIYKLFSLKLKAILAYFFIKLGLIRALVKFMLVIKCYVSTCLHLQAARTW